MVQKFCLVFWLPEENGGNGEQSVEELTKVPLNARKEGSETKLKWGSSRRAQPARVVKISANRAWLESFSLDSKTGRIFESHEKVFTAPVIAEKNVLAAGLRQQGKCQKEAAMGEALKTLENRSLYSTSAQNQHSRNQCSGTQSAPAHNSKSTQKKKRKDKKLAAELQQQGKCQRDVAQFQAVQTLQDKSMFSFLQHEKSAMDCLGTKNVAAIKRTSIPGRGLEDSSTSQVSFDQEDCGVAPRKKARKKEAIDIEEEEPGSLGHYLKSMDAQTPQVCRKKQSSRVQSGPPCRGDVGNPHPRSGNPSGRNISASTFTAQPRIRNSTFVQELSTESGEPETSGSGSVSLGRSDEYYMSKYRDSDSESIVSNEDDLEETEEAALQDPRAVKSDCLIRKVVSDMHDDLIPHASDGVLKFLNAVIESLGRAQLPSELNQTTEFLEMVKTLMKSAVDSDSAKPKFVKVPDRFLVGGSGKIELHPNSGIFMDSAEYVTLKSRLPDPSCWKQLVRALLIEIYGPSLKWMSAKGTKSTIGINAKLLKGLYGLAKTLAPEDFTKRKFHTFINKSIDNRKPKKAKCLKAEDDVEPPPTAALVPVSSGGSIEKQNESGHHVNDRFEDVASPSTDCESDEPITVPKLKPAAQPQSERTAVTLGNNAMVSPAEGVEQSSSPTVHPMDQQQTASLAETTITPTNTPAAAKPAQPIMESNYLGGSYSSEEVSQFFQQNQPYYAQPQAAPALEPHHIQSQPYQDRMRAFSSTPSPNFFTHQHGFQNLHYPQGYSRQDNSGMYAVDPNSESSIVNTLMQTISSPAFMQSILRNVQSSQHLPIGGHGETSHIPNSQLFSPLPHLQNLG